MWFKVLLLAVFAHYSYEAGVTLDRNRTPCACGAINRGTRIVGGVETEVGEYPWMAEIRQRFPVANDFQIIDLCGAAIVHPQYVVTAAHCFVRVEDIRQLVVYFGDHDTRTTNEAFSITRTVTTVTPHPNYNTTTQANDLAILKLSSPITYQRNIQPICMPPNGLNMEAQEIIVTGWGSTEAAGAPSPVLMEATIPIIPTKQCKDKFSGTVAVIDKSTLCAGTPNGTKDACQGDSGGPAALRCEDSHSLAGVVSYGIGCGNPRYPGVYTNVSNYMSWIIQNTPGASLCGSECYPSGQVESDCGWANNSPPRSKRIVGGQVTSYFKYPWVASIYINKFDNNTGKFAWTLSCSGSIISSEWVLTSAKCLDGFPIDSVFAVVGDYDVTDFTEPDEEEFFLTRIEIHPSYNNPRLANDIALIKLDGKLTFSDYVKPVCLPSTKALSSNFSDIFLKLLGWGRTSTDGSFSSKLKEVSLYAIANSQCRLYYGSVITDSMVCTASSNQGDACDGDIGGPLMLQGGSGRYYVAAVQAFRSAKGCGAGNPAGNTRVTPYLSWIQTTTGVSPASTSDVLPVS